MIFCSRVMNWKRSLILAIAFLGATSAKADLLTLDASGTFADGATLSGTLTINTTTGVATAADLIVSAPDSLTFDFIQFQGLAGPIYEIQTGTAATGKPNFDIALAETSLIGYSGGPMESAATGSASDIRYSSTDVVILSTGELTPVPEPSPFALLSTVLGAVGFLACKRRVAKARQS